MIYKKYQSTDDIFLQVGDRVTDELNWKNGEIYQSYWKTTRMFGTELYIQTEKHDMPSVISELWLWQNGFIEVS